MKLKYYVIYRYYTEFDDAWDAHYNSFDSIDKAKIFIRKIKDNKNYCGITGPLVNILKKRNPRK